MYKLIITLTFISNIYANQIGCKSCHNHELSEIHQEITMMNEITTLAQSINEPNCTICHGGDTKASTKEKAHKGAPKKHPGGLKIFAKDPSLDETIENVCAMCHEPSSL